MNAPSMTGKFLCYWNEGKRKLTRRGEQTSEGGASTAPGGEHLTTDVGADPTGRDRLIGSVRRLGPDLPSNHRCLQMAVPPKERKRAAVLSGREANAHDEIG